MLLGTTRSTAHVYGHLADLSRERCSQQQPKHKLCPHGNNATHSLHVERQMGHFKSSSSGGGGGLAAGDANGGITKNWGRPAPQVDIGNRMRRQSSRSSA